jgi:hypothetical protein
MATTSGAIPKTSVSEIAKQAPMIVAVRLKRTLHEPYWIFVNRVDLDLKQLPHVKTQLNHVSRKR